MESKPQAGPGHSETDPTNMVLRALAAAGVNAVAQVLPESTRTAAHAASALGCEVGAIANSLVFMADNVPLLIMTSGAHRVDLDLVASQLDKGEIRRATPQEVRGATGQPIGGVSPVGHPEPIETVVDIALKDYPSLWAAAGTPNAVFSTDFDDLVRATGAIVMKVS